MGRTAGRLSGIGHRPVDNLPRYKGKCLASTDCKKWFQVGIMTARILQPAAGAVTVAPPETGCRMPETGPDPCAVAVARGNADGLRREAARALQELRERF